MTALLPPPGAQPQLPNNAAAPEQLARMLDALLVLDAQKSCSIKDLAHRVGLKPERLRELLSSFMVAGSEAVGPDAPFSIVFGSAAGPTEADEEYDEDQAKADYVHRESSRDEHVALVDDVGRKPITVDQVAAALLAGRALLEAGTLEPRHRDAVAALLDKLGAAMHMTLTEPVDPDAQRLRTAARARQRVSFRYYDVAEGTDETLTVEPYDVRRRRDSFVLDAGPDPAEVYRTYDISSMSDLRKVGEPDAFETPSLPDRTERDRPVQVVLRVPADSPAIARLRAGWAPEEIAPNGDHVDVRIQVDRPAAARIGVLVLQLGPGTTVVSPESLHHAVERVAKRVLAAHPA